MSLREQGFRFYMSRDGQQSLWMRPVVAKQLKPNWIDATELSADEIEAICYGDAKQETT